MWGEEIIGLSTNEALHRLHSDLKSVLEETSKVKNDWANRRKSWIYDTLHHRSQYTTICWTSAALLLISILSLIVAYNYGSCKNHHTLIFDVLCIFLLLVLNLFVVGWDNNLRNGEILTRAKQLLDNLEKSKKSVKWTSLNYPHLCSPTSPCISLQWTYRDGEVVNLPWALLVKGDVIIVRPGQAAPGLCIPLDDKSSPVLHAHEIYSPAVTANESITLPAARAPLENKKYILQETPYLRNLKVALDQSVVKPISYHNKERHLIMINCIEQTTVPILVVLTLLINIMRYLYLDQWFGRGDISEMMIIQPISIVLPLLPLIFPIFWFLLNAYGIARIRAILQQSTPTQILDPFEDTDVGETKQPVMKFKYSELHKYFIDVLFGRGPFLTRSVNILHVLGSVTALCCVDKKGILSWPNPTAEKVFFLKNSVHPNKSTESLNSECTPQVVSGQGLHTAEESEDGVNSKPFLRDGAYQTVPEVLDLTHDHSSSFRLQFDDPTWKQHLCSLKPLGLAILLNTCNMATQEHYAQFYSHIACEAIHNEDLVPVTNRRCLCELAKQIGFIDQAQDIFQLEEQLCTFKHVQTDSVRRDIKFARQLSISTKLKFPFPHMMATVVQEKKSGCLQLMSQGTAEVILDSCVEYWDGHDLYPLTPADRKKILDFYQRSSLTAYCTAFAYRPLSKGVNSKLSHVYLELPADSKYLYLPYRSPTPMAVTVVDNKWKGILPQFHSTDSLLNMDVKEEEVSDIEGCFELQCNQIFIGMVTMQYQAQIDIVQLIEQLDRACIRFVHFSKENELRSRVFSEKMGLESGWNCHISLLSERNRSESCHSDSWVNISLSRRSQLSPLSFVQNSQSKNQYSSVDQEVHELNSVRANLASSRAMSFSAPSAINLELLTVKFDEETGNVDWTDDGLESKPPASTRDKRTSEDSVIVQSTDLNSQPEPWRSLSCLTDSTDQSVPVNFDIWNRAKLPRGIDNIRPHLDVIDNVPLLVSLFTDCTPTVTKEMLHIMQDYGEVVCVMGSSANCENIGIFMQADASIAVEPLYPQVCQKIPAFSEPVPSTGPSPIELSRALNSIACAVSLRREDPFSIYHLVMEARHYTQCLTNCLQFWVCSMVALSFLQFLAVVFMLPPLFSIHQILYISCALVPILSVSLVALPTNAQVMQKATGKNQCKINVEVSIFILWCYGSKFIPSVFIIIILYSTTMACFCNEIAKATDTTCTMIYPNVNMTKLFLESLEGSLNSSDILSVEIPTDCWRGWSYFQFTLLSVQHLCAFSFVLHIAATSSSFVHRDHSLWQKLPTSNCLWLLSVLVVILMQGIFSTVELSNAPSDIRLGHLVRFSLPWFIVVIVIVSPFLVFIINEGVKWQEIKVNQRFQRRKRLDFGTKLGMNSPF